MQIKIVCIGGLQYYLPSLPKVCISGAGQHLLVAGLASNIKFIETANEVGTHAGGTAMPADRLQTDVSRIDRLPQIINLRRRVVIVTCEHLNTKQLRNYNTYRLLPALSGLLHVSNIDVIRFRVFIPDTFYVF